MLSHHGGAATPFPKQRMQPSLINNLPKSGPARFAGRRLRSNPKKPGNGRWSLLQSDGSWLFRCPDGSLRRYSPNWRKQEASTAQPTSPVKSFCTALILQIDHRNPRLPQAVARGGLPEKARTPPPPITVPAAPPKPAARRSDRRRTAGPGYRSRRRRTAPGYRC